MTSERPPERPDMPPPADPASHPDGGEAAATSEGSMPSTPSMALDGAMPGAAVGTGAIDTTSDAPATPIEPTTVEPLVPATPVAAEDAAASDAPVAKGSRRGAAARGTVRVIQSLIGVGLFVFGIWIGMQVFQSTQKSSDPVGATAVSNGVPTPPAVQEFAHALQTGGPDAVRSSVSNDVFSLLAYELQRWDYANITKVDVLSTAVDGPRSATGLILTGTTTDGRTMWINLVVHTDNGQISTLR